MNEKFLLLKADLEAEEKQIEQIYSKLAAAITQSLDAEGGIVAG